RLGIEPGVPGLVVLELEDVDVAALPFDALLGQTHARLLRADRAPVVIERQHHHLRCRGLDNSAWRKAEYGVASRGTTMGRSTPLIAGTAGMALLVLAMVGTRGAAQDAYPTRPVLLTHGFAAGGNGDVVSRIIGDALSPRLGQPVVIEPRPGA